MTTIYFKPKKGSGGYTEQKEIRPAALEDHTYFYYNQYDQVCSTEQNNVAYFKTDSKQTAIECAMTIKHTGRYIAIVQVKKDYYVWLDAIDKAVCPEGKQVRVLNDD